jgi:hypothetical protein
MNRKKRSSVSIVTCYFLITEAPVPAGERLYAYQGPLSSGERKIREVTGVCQFVGSCLWGRA